MSAACPRPPVPPASRYARPPHLPPSLAPVTPGPGHSGHMPGYTIASTRPSTILQCLSPTLAPFSQLCLWSSACACSPAPPPPCSVRHPHLHHPLSRVCDPQHVPAGPPLYLLTVPVTRTCTILLAVSAILSTCPLARPSTSLQCPSSALAPFS